MEEKDWDAVAARFEQEIFNVPANDRQGLIKGLVGRYATSTGTAADLGCGIGRTLPMLAANFKEVYAGDGSSMCLTIAGRKQKKNGASIHYLHADLSAAPIPIPQVDLVLCINTLLTADLSDRLKMMDHICRCVKKGGHLLLVVPSIESALLTHYRRIQQNLREGMTPTSAEKPRAARLPNANGFERGIVHIDKVPTKHFLKEELQDLLAQQDMETEEVLKIEYPWDTEFEKPPRWMKEPWPWDWLVAARKKT